ncbi:MAG: cupin domain-containing protein [Methylocella sp.]
MNIRADFSQRVVVRPGDAEWTPSPQKGVDRLMLDRIGGEIARATSFVRFSPDSVFPHHTHGGGEEIFVMDGVLEDENGRYPTGTYIRDPIGSSHAPFSRQGCTLFAKLWQFAKDDCERIVIGDASRVWRDAAEGFALQPLHKFGEEITYLVRLAPGRPVNRRIDPRGEEILVLGGAFHDEQGSYAANCWIRDPGGREHSLVSEGGCTLFVKTGLRRPDVADMHHFKNRNAQG